MGELIVQRSERTASILAILLRLTAVGWLAMMIALYVDDRRTNPDKPNFLVKWNDELSKTGCPPLPY